MVAAVHRRARIDVVGRWRRRVCGWDPALRRAATTQCGVFTLRRLRRAPAHSPAESGLRMSLPVVRVAYPARGVGMAERRPADDAASPCSTTESRPPPPARRRPLLMAGHDSLSLSYRERRRRQHVLRLPLLGRGPSEVALDQLERQHRRGAPTRGPRRDPLTAPRPRRRRPAR